MVCTCVVEAISYVYSVNLVLFFLHIHALSTLELLKCKGTNGS